MPFMTNGKRDYKRELSWEKKKKPNRVKDRAQRNAARSQVAKAKGVKPTSIKGDGSRFRTFCNNTELVSIF